MKKVFLSSIFVSIALLLGRISGLIRELFIASHYGASVNSDLIVILFTLPDLLITLLVGGALSMVIVPELKEHTESSGRSFYLQFLYFSFFVFLLFSIIAALFSKKLLFLFAPGLSLDALHTGASFLKITLFSIPFTVAAGVTVAYLNHKNKFITPALGTLIFNIILIIALAIANRIEAPFFFYFLSGGVLVASLFRWLILLYNDNFFLFKRGMFGERLLEIQLLKRYLYAVISSGLIFLIPVALRSTATHHGPGFLSIINYSLKLIDLPLGVCITVFSIVFLPTLSAFYVQKDKENFTNLVWDALRVLVFISSFITLAIFFFSYQFTHLLFSHSALLPKDIQLIANLLQIASFSIIFQGINSFLISVLAARKDTTSPLMITSFLVIIFIAICYKYNLPLETLFYVMNFCHMLITFSLILILLFLHKVPFLWTPSHLNSYLIASVYLGLNGAAFFYIKTLQVPNILTIVYTALLGTSTLALWYYTDPRINKFFKK